MEMKSISLEELTDKVIGKIGTPERDQFEARLADDLKTYFIGEEIKKAREAKNMTQEQLGALIGVKKSQVCRMERSGNMTMATLTRVFRALNIPLTLTFGDSHSLSLC